jgi:hypothetical protein
MPTNPALRDYITTARDKGHTDDRIQRDLVAAGWEPAQVRSGLTSVGPDTADDLVPPPPPPPGQTGVQSHRASASHPQPVSVVQNLTTRGLEYIIMFIALGVTALSLASLLHSNVNNLMGNGDSGTLGSNSAVPLATAALVVALPVLAVLFLRLKKAEAADPELHHDPSRKRAIQLTLVVTFLIGLGNIIYFVYSLMTGGDNGPYDYNAVGSQSATGPLGNAIHLLITLAIAGGIFAYYWFDEHRAS